MQTQTYKFKSNARRAARSAGLDPDVAVIEIGSGVFSLNHVKPEEAALDMPECLMLSDEERKTARERKPLPAAPEDEGWNDPDLLGRERKEDPATTKLREELAAEKARKAAVRAAKRNAPPPSTDMPLVGKDAIHKIEETEKMAKKAKTKPTKKPAAKTDQKRSGGEKDATLIKMLGKGATVEAMTTELAWLPHTLRARISRLAKPKSKGGAGFKIERTRTDGVTSYRIAS